MSSPEEVKAEIKKLSAKAMNMKMNLHDLSEELPVNWTSILSVAQETYDAYAALEAARKKLKELETA
ncbi:MAG TPA: CCE_0567 family metalloprotein [Methylocystis sp.]|nr:CCE_0567 family metalloprotein [Methylocystis sp.]